MQCILSKVHSWLLRIRFQVQAGSRNAWVLLDILGVGGQETVSWIPLFFLFLSASLTIKLSNLGTVWEKNSQMQSDSSLLSNKIQTTGISIFPNNTDNMIANLTSEPQYIFNMAWCLTSVFNWYWKPRQEKCGRLPTATRKGNFFHNILAEEQKRVSVALTDP